MMSDDVSVLIQRVGLGDRAAFRRLYDLTSPKLFAVCLRILRDRGEAEDALQEVYVKVWHNASKFTVSDYSPITWLAAVARNHAIDRTRARKPDAADIDEVVETPDDRPDPEMDDQRRRYYRLTAVGRAAAASEVRRLDGIVQAVRGWAFKGSG